eukprot:5395055-Prymnesium_polylepis.1
MLPRSASRSKSSAIAASFVLSGNPACTRAPKSRANLSSRALPEGSIDGVPRSGKGTITAFMHSLPSAWANVPS